VLGSSDNKVWYAELDENNLVLAVHIMDGMKVAGGGEDLSAGAEAWVQNHLGTSNNVKQCFKYKIGDTHTRKKYPAIGDTYQPSADLFYKTESWPSWTLNTTTYDWEAPVAEPNITTYTDDAGQEQSLLPFLWNEELLAWEAAGQDDRVLRWNGTSWDQITGPSPGTRTYEEDGVTKNYKNLSWSDSENRWECQKEDDTNMYWDYENEIWSEI